jgi:hypothetical protein
MIAIAQCTICAHELLIDIIDNDAVSSARLAAKEVVQRKHHCATSNKRFKESVSGEIEIFWQCRMNHW